MPACGREICPSSTEARAAGSHKWKPQHGCIMKVNTETGITLNAGLVLDRFT